VEFIKSNPANPHRSWVANTRFRQNRQNRHRGVLGAKASTIGEFDYEGMEFMLKVYNGQGHSGRPV
jgi:hypothetical protein